MKKLCLTHLFIVSLLLVFLLAMLAIQFTPGLQLSSYRVPFNQFFGIGSPEPTAKIPGKLSAAEGLVVSVFADEIPNARLLKITPTGQLLVSSPKTGNVYLLEDNNRDGRAENAKPLIKGLNRPHGIDIYNDGKHSWLYIAETDAVGRMAVHWGSGKVITPYRRIITGLPSDGGHWTRTIHIGPDNWLYLTIGSSCNVCEEKDSRRATMMRYRPDGSEGHIYASGLRNSVGFDWSPWSGNLFATDNGRDLLGDDYPPCELNHITPNGFYGWPYINGFGDLDPDYGQNKEPLLATSLSPSFGFRAHNAPLGIHFLQHPSRPNQFQRTALVALHGSWNRSEPDGYKVISLHWNDREEISSEDFLTGFLQSGGKIIGRPVDVEEGPDGSIYVSDDYAGAIYRVLYK